MYFSKARVALSKFWSIIRPKKIIVCHHNAFPYATGVSNFGKSAETSETPKCLGGAGRFWKNRKKQKTALPELSTPVTWPRYDLQLNYSIGGNFNIHPPTFGMDGRFPFHYAPGSFPSQNFCHFHPTLAGPISDQAGPSGILLNRSDSLASVVSESDSPTDPRHLKVWQKKTKNNMTNGR